MQVPAFCDRCQNPFPTGFDAAFSTVAMSNVTAGPCPWCGYASGRTADGVFEFTRDTMRIIEASGTTADQLRHYLSLIQTGQAQGRSAEEIVDRIERENPSLVERLREGANNPYVSGFIVSALIEAAKLLAS